MPALPFPCGANIGRKFKVYAMYYGTGDQTSISVHSTDYETTYVAELIVNMLKVSDTGLSHLRKGLVENPIGNSEEPPMPILDKILGQTEEWLSQWPKSCCLTYSVTLE